MKIKNLTYLSAALAITGTCLSAKPKPNILLILIDDMGYPAVSCYGNKLVQTPNIDRIAAAGVRFTSGYVCPQSTPTRACLMTGQYGGRNKMWHVIPKYGFPFARMEEPEYLDNLPRETFTIGKALKSAGYATACIGKWHLSTYDNDGYYTYLYNDRAHYFGFDYVNGKTDPPEYQSYGDKGVAFLTNEAIGFMERNRNNPFFLFLSHHTIHNPVLAPDEIVKEYNEQGYKATGINPSVYLAALKHLDNSVGDLLNAVKRLGLEKNTIIVFISDNGGVDAQFDNYPLRYGKGSAYEGGIRVPFIIKWPGFADDARVVDIPVHIVDLYPTFCELAGITNPQNITLDGESLVPLLRGKTSAVKKLSSRALYFFQPLYDIQWGATPSASIIENGYKLIHFFGDYIDLDNGGMYIPEGRTELYNLRDDIGESSDLGNVIPKLREDMLEKLMNWISSQGAEIPEQNINFDISRWSQRSNEK